LHAIGLTTDLKKPFVGIGLDYRGNPVTCILMTYEACQVGTLEENIVGLIFNTGCGDGISMGTPGMRYSVAIIVIIADSMETVNFSHEL
jgi:dihydroxy-acid dehydratase